MCTCARHTPGIMSSLLASFLKKGGSLPPSSLWLPAVLQLVGTPLSLPTPLPTIHTFKIYSAFTSWQNHLIVKSLYRQASTVKFHIENGSFFTLYVWQMCSKVSQTCESETIQTPQLQVPLLPPTTCNGPRVEKLST